MTMMIMMTMVLTRVMLLCTVVEVMTAHAQEQGTCQDRFGSFNVSTFRRRQCTLCYGYLFPRGKALQPLWSNVEYLVYTNTSFLIVPDADEYTIWRRICQTLTADECARWRSCCQAAYECCERQLQEAHVYSPESCPRRWDGYGCWNAAPAGTTISMKCPTFIDHALPTRMAVKTCTTNSTWFTKGGLEWTNYTGCMHKGGLLALVFVGLACNILSITMLLPALIVSVFYKDLVKQDRIRIHINFFASLVLCSTATILWDVLIRHDLLTSSRNSLTLMYNNTIGCKALSIFKIYFKSTTYMWMFCEGYFLHRLVTNAFKRMDYIRHFYIIGWGLPILPTASYSVVRALLYNKSCWAVNADSYEWIIYTPNLVCLTLNLIFLCNILRILVFRLHGPAEEPSTFRRGVRAALILIPLFGMQLFLTIYHPQPGSEMERVYEIASVCISDLQGAFVAMIICFCNTEVISLVRRSCHKVKILRPQRSLTTYVSEAPGGHLENCHSQYSQHSHRGSHVSTAPAQQTHRSSLPLPRGTRSPPQRGSNTSLPRKASFPISHTWAEENTQSFQLKPLGQAAGAQGDPLNMLDQCNKHCERHRNVGSKPSSNLKVEST